MLIKHENTSHRELFANRLLWVRLAVAVSAALLLSLSSGGPAETSEVDATRATVWDLAEPDDLVTTSQGDDTTAFREEDAGFSAHHRVPDPFEDDGASDLQPRINVTAITDFLLEDPDESNANRQNPGRHVDSGANFGIVELPMIVTPRFESEREIRQVTVYYDDRGWVVAYLPAAAPAAGIWRYDLQDTGDAPGDKANDLDQNLLLLAINEVLAAAKQDVPEIVDADQDTVGYYHWQYPDYNALVLFSHGSSGGTSDPVRFVVPPTIENILPSASVLDTTRETPSAAGASLKVDEFVLTVNGSSRMAVSGFDFDPERPTDKTSLHEVTVTAGADGTAAGAVMLLYRKPGS